MRCRKERDEKREREGEKRREKIRAEVARGRRAGWSIRYPGAPQGGRCSHAVLKSRTVRAGYRWRNGEARRTGVWKKHGGLAPREDLPKTKPERAALTLLDKAADIFDETLVRAYTLTFSQHGS